MRKIDAIAAFFHQTLLSVFIGILTRPLIGLIVFLSISLVFYFIQYGVHLAKKN